MAKTRPGIQFGRNSPTDRSSDKRGAQLPAKDVLLLPASWDSSQMQDSQSTFAVTSDQVLQAHDAILQFRATAK